MDNQVPLCSDCGSPRRVRTARSKYAALRKKTTTRCYSCARKKYWADHPPIGSNNSFFGKKHSEATIARIRASSKKHFSDMSEDQAKRRDFRNRIIAGMNGKTNRKSPYICWLERYGSEEANRRKAVMSAHKSEAARGSRNPMFGRPSPIKSGSGMKGWYKGQFFRSWLEFSALVNFEAHNLTLTSAETSRYAVPYTLDGELRTYYPDFYCQETGDVLEIKPKSCLKMKVNVAKISAAKAKFSNFKVITELEIPLVCHDLALDMISSGQLALTARSKEKMRSFAIKALLSSAKAAAKRLEKIYASGFVSV